MRTSSSSDRRRHRLNALINAYQRQFPKVPVLDWSSVESWQSPTHIVVDVRTDIERRVSQWPGAWTKASLQDRLQNGPPLDSVAVYCTIGYRSGLEARRWQQRHANIEFYNLPGIDAATFENVVLIDGAGQETHKVHTFGSQWNLLADGYQAEYFTGWRLLGHFLRVGATVIECHVQTVRHGVTRCCVAHRQRKHP